MDWKMKWMDGRNREGVKDGQNKDLKEERKNTLSAKKQKVKRNQTYITSTHKQSFTTSLSSKTRRKYQKSSYLNSPCHLIYHFCFYVIPSPYIEQIIFNPNIFWTLWLCVFWEKILFYPLLCLRLRVPSNHAA